MSTPSDDDVGNIMRYLRQPAVADFVSHLIAKRLLDIEGFEFLPREMRHRIEEQAVMLYAAGYTHAVSRRD